MSATNAFETEVLQLLFKNTAIADIGNSAGLPASSVDGDYFIALYTTAPTESTAGTEANYGGYARVSVPRNTGFTLSGNQVSNTADVNFPTATSGSNNIVGWAICKTGASAAIIYGTFASQTIDTGKTPKFLAGQLIVSLD